MDEWMGWFGALCLGICAIPQAYESWNTGNSSGITWGLLILWWLGEVFTLGYIAGKDTLDLPLITNYVANTFFVSVIIWFKLHPRTRTGEKQ